MGVWGVALHEDLASAAAAPALYESAERVYHREGRNFKTKGRREEEMQDIKSTQKITHY